MSGVGFSSANALYAFLDAIKHDAKAKGQEEFFEAYKLLSKEGHVDCNSRLAGMLKGMRFGDAERCMLNIVYGREDSLSCLGVSKRMFAKARVVEILVMHGRLEEEEANAILGRNQGRPVPASNTGSFGFYLHKFVLVWFILALMTLTLWGGMVALGHLKVAYHAYTHGPKTAQGVIEAQAVKTAWENKEVEIDNKMSEWVEKAAACEVQLDGLKAQYSAQVDAVIRDMAMKCHSNITALLVRVEEAEDKLAQALDIIEKGKTEAAVALTEHLQEKSAEVTSALIVWHEEIEEGNKRINAVEDNNAERFRGFHQDLTNAVTNLQGVIVKTGQVQNALPSLMQVQMLCDSLYNPLTIVGIVACAFYGLVWMMTDLWKRLSQGRVDARVSSAMMELQPSHHLFATRMTRLQKDVDALKKKNYIHLTVNPPSYELVRLLLYVTCVCLAWSFMQYLMSWFSPAAWFRSAWNIEWF
jgi:hypothetical protein